MIEISPAILTDDPKLFADKLQAYHDLPVAQIDIDIAEQAFVGNDTLNIDQVLDLVGKAKPNVAIGYHLMLAHPQAAVEKIRQLNSDHKIYVHLEADLKFLIGKQDCGLAIKAESDLPELQVLEPFAEVQLMTIKTGKQGNPFLPEVSQKVTALRELGYTGKISIDGGVNLHTAQEIKHWGVDRVSVGSYFQKSKDPELAYMKLELALNLREDMNS